MSYESFCGVVDRYSKSSGAELQNICTDEETGAHLAVFKCGVVIRANTSSTKVSVKWGGKLSNHHAYAEV